MKDMNNKTVANTLNDERLTAFPLRLGTGFRCPLSPLLFNIVLKILINDYAKNRWEEFRLKRKKTPFTGGITSYIKNPKKSLNNY